MTRTSIRELVESWRPRYLGASRKEKSRILDEFVALTGYHRKSAIRLLRQGYRPKPLDRRGRPRVYTPDVKAALLEVWEACECICSKCLAPFLPEIVAVLKTRRPKPPTWPQHHQPRHPSQAPDPCTDLRRLGRCPTGVPGGGPGGPLWGIPPHADHTGHRHPLVSFPSSLVAGRRP